MNYKNRYHSILASIYRNIEYYKEMIRLSSNSTQRTFFESQLDNERIRLNNWKNYYYHYINNLENNQDQRMGPKEGLPKERVFTIQELAQNDGANGQPAYVAVNNIVYDVSSEATWGGGTHFSLYAGRDLSEQFNGCHQGRLLILRNLPKVGVLDE